MDNRYWPEATVKGTEGNHTIGHWDGGFASLPEAVLSLYDHLQMFLTEAIEEGHIFDCLTGENIYSVDSAHMAKFKKLFDPRPEE